MYLDLIDSYTEVLSDLDTKITEALSPSLTAARELLCSIPGWSTTVAEIFLAETGGDMTVFATAGHLASWAGVCPGVNESAGVNKSGAIRPGNANLKRILGTAAMAAVKAEDSYYAAYYRRVAARRGSRRALVAVMHKLVIAIWHVLHDKTDFHDLDADYFARKNPERALRAMTRRLQAHIVAAE
jgi:transposase